MRVRPGCCIAGIGRHMVSWAALRPALATSQSICSSNTPSLSPYPPAASCAPAPARQQVGVQQVLQLEGVLSQVQLAARDGLQLLPVTAGWVAPGRRGPWEVSTSAEEERAGMARLQPAAHTSLVCRPVRLPRAGLPPTPPTFPHPHPLPRSSPLPDGLVRQRLEQRQQVQEVVDGAPAVLVRRPVAQRQRQLLALRLELVDLSGKGAGGRQHSTGRVKVQVRCTRCAGSSRAGRHPDHSCGMLAAAARCRPAKPSPPTWLAMASTRSTTSNHR